MIFKKLAFFSLFFRTSRFHFIFDIHFPAIFRLRNGILCKQTKKSVPDFYSFYGMESFINLSLKARKLKQYAFKFAIKRTWFRQLNACKAPNNLPLSIDPFHYSNNAKRCYSVLYPFLKPYWHFEKISSKKLDICLKTHSQVW